MPSGQDEVWTFTYVLEYGPATRGPSPASSMITRRPRTATPHGTAEDVVSLNFLAAWRLREKLLPDAELSDDTGDGLRPWLFGIATNALRNTQRTALRYRAALARLLERHMDRQTVPDFADERAPTRQLHCCPASP